jgi:SAP domain-containing ribonucleoprotein
MPEYAKMKNAELEGLLKARGLTTGGKKADMVDRLTKDDEQKKDTTQSTGAPASASAKPTSGDAEDEIDWDDDAEPAATDAAKPAAPAESASDPAAEAVARAGGKGAVDNPQAVPNQVADIDPSKTADLSVKSPTEQKEDAADEAKVEEKKEPTPDYTRGLAPSNLDVEIEKRKARAKKFGLNIEEDEGLKKLERAKKFGETGPPKGLDEALPERSRKRGRDATDDGAGGRDKRRGGRFGGRRGRDDRGDRVNRNDRGGDRRRDSRDGRGDDRSRTNNGSNWMSEADKAKAEARKNKWAAPAASS